MEAIYQKLIDIGTVYGARIVGAIIILVVGRLIIGLLTSLVKKLLGKAKVEPTLTKFLASMTKIALMMFLFIAVLGTLGVQTASFIAVIGAAGLAVGFALQGSLGNLASGVMLILFRPFRVGDFVEVGGHMGTVKEVHIFNTILTTPNNQRVIIPNGKVTSDSIVNYTVEGKRRLDMVFGISYDDDIKKAKEALMDLLESDERVLKDPAPMVAVKELGDSSVNFAVRGWVDSADYWNVYFDLNEKGKLGLEAAGCTIPFPQRDVHMFQVSA